MDGLMTPVFYMTVFAGKPLWAWAVFFVLVLSLLALDLGVLQRRDEEIGVAKSLKMSAFYIAIALSFGVWIWVQMGAQSGAEYMTAFLVEKTLALDNIFVISLVFTYFGVPRQYQHRVLFWGILGVIVLRGIMIALGATLVHNFEWILYLFSLFLIYTGVKMLRSGEDDAPDISQNIMLKILRKRMRITADFYGHDFTVKLKDPESGKTLLWFTPLFVALLMVETVDIIFAVDSVPAVFAITSDPYIVYTSNIFAILGLRALYFALAAVLHRFEYLKHAVSLILIFIGSKLFVAYLLGLEKFPASVSLSVTLALLAGGVIASMIKVRR